MNTDRSCAVFGQHPLRFPWGFDEEAEGCRRMKLELAQSILELRQQGVTEFQVACDPGVGLYAGEIVHALAEQERNIRLVCVMPHEGQATKWTPQLRERYFDMLACCDEVRCLAPRAQPGGQGRRLGHGAKQAHADDTAGQSGAQLEQQALRYEIRSDKK